jgi:Calcineurin-like phosphoesterase
MDKPASTPEYLLHCIKVWKEQGSISAAARTLHMPRQTFQYYVLKARQTFPDQVPSIANWYKQPKKDLNDMSWTVPKVLIPDDDIKTVLVGGDAHIWPGEPSIMWQAFCKVAKALKPDCIILNGDIIDGAKVSRHGRLLGSKMPSITDEINAVHQHLKMLPTAPHRIWVMGNHDIRVNNYLANIAPELEEYAGSITDRFPLWTFCWSAVINDVEIRHRFRGGIHTAWNNALHSGVNMVTSHTHQLQVTAVRNRKGSHYGIEIGMLADPYGPQFEYAEGIPSRSCCGFAYLSFDKENNLMPPEMAEMIRGRPAFRGKYVF